MPRLRPFLFVLSIDTMPVVMLRRRILAWNPQLALVNGDLWVGRRNIRTPDRQFALQRYHKTTLAPVGEPVTLSGSRHGESARMSVDARGDLHAAGTLNRATEPAVAGWYNTLARASAGLPAITYLTTNRNASGAGFPIPDARSPDRVYVVHWHGAVHDHHEPPAGAEGNFFHYVRLHKGEKAIEGRKISDRPSPHGHSYRHTPCAAAHPDGGIFVVFQESTSPDRLVFTTVGVGPSGSALGLHDSGSTGYLKAPRLRVQGSSYGAPNTSAERGSANPNAAFWQGQ